MSPRATAGCLLLLCLVVYNGNGRLIEIGDSFSTRLVPFALLLDGTASLDRFYADEVGGADGLSHAPAPVRAHYYYLTPSRGKLVSTYPLTLPVLVTPLYAPIVWLKGEWSNDEAVFAARVLEKLTASLIAALSAAAMYLLLAGLTDRGPALGLTAAFAFGTTTWTTSSQALWQHGAGVLFIVLALAVLVRRPGWLWLAGLFAGLAVAIRPTNVFFWMAVVGVYGWTHRSVGRTLALALPGVALGGIVAAYNLAVFGDVRGGYGRFAGIFHSSLFEAVSGLLVSPSRGLLIYSPVLLAGFAGLWFAWRGGPGRGSPAYTVCACFLVAQLLCMGAWGWWWGGFSYGPRLLTEAAAVLVVLSVPAVERLRTRRWARAAFAALLAYSVGVQALGAVKYSSYYGWNSVPLNVDYHPERLWDWRDAQIPRTAKILVEGFPE